jgi:AhpC/TSA family
MTRVARSAERDRPHNTKHEPGRHIHMSESSPGLKLGQTVPDFELTTFDPSKGDFGKFSLSDQIARKRWTILFFYPADFTFV